MASANATERNDHRPVIRTDHDGICELRLNDPDKYNTLSREVLDVMSENLADIATDQSVRVVVIAARGKAFCSGHNLKQMHANHGEAYFQFITTLPIIC